MKPRKNVYNGQQDVKDNTKSRRLQIVITNIQLYFEPQQNETGNADEVLKNEFDKIFRDKITNLKFKTKIRKINFNTISPNFVET